MDSTPCWKKRSATASPNSHSWPKKAAKSFRSRVTCSSWAACSSESSAGSWLITAWCDSGAAARNFKTCALEKPISLASTWSVTSCSSNASAMDSTPKPKKRLALSWQLIELKKSRSSSFSEAALRFTARYSSTSSDPMLSNADTCTCRVRILSRKSSISPGVRRKALAKSLSLRRCSSAASATDSTPWSKKRHALCARWTEVRKSTKSALSSARCSWARATEALRGAEGSRCPSPPSSKKGRPMTRRPDALRHTTRPFLKTTRTRFRQSDANRTRSAALGSPSTTPLSPAARPPLAVSVKTTRSPICRPSASGGRQQHAKQATQQAARGGKTWSESQTKGGLSVS
mmetsp:Transcript_68638/g.155246  ORF Transcript_68638/g.155246 Transcript_68638/m.155246 type:complete len:346 (-) Transcript_68638:1184-2221(-)